MTGPLHDGHISVEDLGDPEPLPPEFADAIAGDEEAAEEAPRAGDELLEAKAGWVAGVIRTAFGLAGYLGGIRMPPAVKERIARLWAISPPGAMELAQAVAPIVPDRFVRSRAVQALGTLGVAFGLFKLTATVAERAAATAQIRHEVIVHASPDAGSETATDSGARRAGPRRRPADRPAAGQPEPDRTPPPVDGFTGAGLGLGEDG